MDTLIEYKTRTTCGLRQEKCNDCRAHWHKVLRIKDHESNLGEFDVYFCRRCRLGFTDPYPTEETSGSLYGKKETSDFDVIRDSPVDSIKDFLSVRWVRRLAPHDRVRSVLDYATGNGRFAVSAAKAFPDARVDAVDYQPAAPPLLKRPGDVPVRYRSLTEFAGQHERYDLIILRHVLEHTHNPVQLLKGLSERLDRDGIIYIEVPNLESGCAKVFGKYWKGYYVPRHLFHFTIPSLAEVAGRAGLQAEIGRNEMPLMGNTVSIMAKVDHANPFVQGLGILLHPLQLALEAWHRSSTCINARCKHKIARRKG